MYILNFDVAKLGNTFQLCKYFNKKSYARLKLFYFMLRIT